MSKAAALRDGAFWKRVGTRFLPFADAATTELPLGRLLRLSLFQVSVGMAAVLLTGTLNRVMIVELGMASSVVAAMVSLPLLFAPMRALIGFKSDHHQSILGWKRVPYIWFGTLLQFGGFALLPFALLVMSGGEQGPGDRGTDWRRDRVPDGRRGHAHHADCRACARDRPCAARSASARGRIALRHAADRHDGQRDRDRPACSTISPRPTSCKSCRVRGALTVVLNITALWKQEARRRGGTEPEEARATFREVWAIFIGRPRTMRLLVATGLGAAAFSMQDVLLEPYGGQILGLSVGATHVADRTLGGRHADRVRACRTQPCERRGAAPARRVRRGRRGWSPSCS